MTSTAAPGTVSLTITADGVPVGSTATISQTLTMNVTIQ